MTAFAPLTFGLNAPVTITGASASQTVLFPYAIPLPSTFGIGDGEQLFTTAKITDGSAGLFREAIPANQVYTSPVLTLSGGGGDDSGGFYVALFPLNGSPYDSSGNIDPAAIIEGPSVRSTLITKTAFKALLTSTGTLRDVIDNELFSVSIPYLGIARYKTGMASFANWAMGIITTANVTTFKANFTAAIVGGRSIPYQYSSGYSVRVPTGP